MPESLNFRISSQLKSVIGRDLITDDYVAIFELVKNSFDAKAKGVVIFFGNDKIYLIDDGKGLSYEDIVQKWLFVAYSAKKDGSEDNDLSDHEDYRNDIKINAHYAGSKGVGRFSCDRLGSKLTLQSRTSSGSPIGALDVDWNDFEKSFQDEFINIPVFYRELDKFEIPDGVPTPAGSGTVISISGCRELWDRKKLLELKSSLAKLINPFGSEDTNFSIIIYAPSETEEDKHIINRYGDDAPPNSVVNGPVQNFIFQTLQSKTTWLRTWIDDSTGRILTELSDRGTVIYRVSEELPYANLLGSNFECNLFYLNRAAKHTFTRRMGVSSVEFGSVFLFKNGFRVYPIGERKDDSFGIDRRKQQGHSRFLGTRDVVGRIDVHGDDSKFRESSSRDKGLISTPAAQQLDECFWQKCFTRLENYVVGVSWRLKFDMDLDDASFLSGDEAKSKVIAVLARLVSSPDLTVEYYDKDILSIVSNKVDEYGKTIENLAALAYRVGDVELEQSARDAAVKYVEMQKAEAEAIAFAERERKARKQAELKTEQTVASLEVVKKQNLFLTSLQAHDKEILENLHHQVIIYASNAVNNIEANILMLRNGVRMSSEEFQVVLEDLLLLNQQVIAASRFATSANFMLDSSSITTDLSAYIEEYVERICSIYESRISVEVNNESPEFALNFKPIEISIVLDNLIDNAYKAGASTIRLELSRPESNVLKIDAKDNGMGLNEAIKDGETIFEKGITTTRGSGLGLYHVRQLLSGMKSTINLSATSHAGTTFTIRVYK